MHSFSSAWHHQDHDRSSSSASSSSGKRFLWWTTAVTTTAQRSSSSSSASTTRSSRSAAASSCCGRRRWRIRLWQQPILFILLLQLLLVLMTGTGGGGRHNHNRDNRMALMVAAQETTATDIPSPVVICPHGDELRNGNVRLDSSDPVQSFDEISGLAISRRIRGPSGSFVVYGANDSGGGSPSGTRNRLGIFDSGTGQRLRTLVIEQNERDWESMDIGPCYIDGRDRACIFIANTGDNDARTSSGKNGERNGRYEIYRFLEPNYRNYEDNQVIENVDALFYRYTHPTSPTQHADVEAVFVDPTGWGINPQNDPYPNQPGDLYLVPRWRDPDHLDKNRVFKIPVSFWDELSMPDDGLPIIHEPQAFTVGTNSVGDHEFLESTFTSASMSGDGTLIALGTGSRIWLYLRCPGQSVIDAMQNPACYEWWNFNGQMETNSFESSDTLTEIRNLQIPEGDNPQMGWTTLFRNVPEESEATCPVVWFHTDVNGNRKCIDGREGNVYPDAWCDDGMPLYRSVKPPTSVAPPSSPPTMEPTTLAPTLSPTTMAPTDAPTSTAPTKAPTMAPTDAPTSAAPTKAPTMAPTAAPAMAPVTQGPTLAPTTQAPTLAPTSAEPTVSVNPTSSMEPTTSTLRPTVAPTTTPLTPSPAAPTGGLSPANVSRQTALDTPLEIVPDAVVDFVYVIGRPENGSLEIQNDNKIIYTPYTGFVGLDSFKVDMCYADAQCARMTFFVQVGTSGVRGASGGEDDGGGPSKGLYGLAALVLLPIIVLAAIFQKRLACFGLGKRLGCSGSGDDEGTSTMDASQAVHINGQPAKAAEKNGVLENGEKGAAKNGAVENGEKGAAENGEKKALENGVHENSVHENGAVEKLEVEQPPHHDEAALAQLLSKNQVQTPIQERHIQIVEVATAQKVPHDMPANPERSNTPENMNQCCGDGDTSPRVVL